MIRLDGATVLLQWAAGGLAFLWVTTRRREVGLGYGWLVRSLYAVFAIGSIVVGVIFEPVPVREVFTGLMVVATTVALVVSIVRRREGAAKFPAWLDAIAPSLGLVALVAAGIDAGYPAAVSLARVIVGAAFLGAVSDAMLLGHWYLVQPGLSREPLNQMVRCVGYVWPAELLVMLWPTGMVSALRGTVDDGANGLLSWFWVACAAATIVLVVVTRAALREKQYAAVMAATGLLYLAILTAFGMDLVARAILA
jgi:uncharacterized membrane protein YhdT